MNNGPLLYTILGLSVTIITFISIPYIVKVIRFFTKSNYAQLGQSSKMRLIYQLETSVNELVRTKTGALITITNKQSLEQFRTDGILINANVSSALILSLFNKKSPLHDGAIIIDKNKITYAATFYKITNKSIDNKYGARHRAAMGISEQTDALTIIVSEENGGITIAKQGNFIKVKKGEFRDLLTKHLKIN